jgi:hypothetical protein
VSIFLRSVKCLPATDKYGADRVRVVLTCGHFSITTWEEFVMHMMGTDKIPELRCRVCYEPRTFQTVGDGKTSPLITVNTVLEVRPEPVDPLITAMKERRAGGKWRDEEKIAEKEAHPVRVMDVDVVSATWADVDKTMDKPARPFALLEGADLDRFASGYGLVRPFRPSGMPDREFREELKDALTFPGTAPRGRPNPTSTPSGGITRAELLSQIDADAKRAKNVLDSMGRIPSLSEASDKPTRWHIRDALRKMKAQSKKRDT